MGDAKICLGNIACGSDTLRSSLDSLKGESTQSLHGLVLQGLVMDLEVFENYPWGKVAFKVLMDSLK